MTHTIKGNPIVFPDLFTALPNFPYNFKQEEELGFRFLKSVVDIEIPKFDSGMYKAEKV